MRINLSMGPQSCEAHVELSRVLAIKRYPSTAKHENNSANEEVENNVHHVEVHCCLD